MNSERIYATLKKLPVEAVIWIIGLAFLAWSDPLADPHFKICPLAMAGFDWCPGCGLGRSVSFIFRGDFESSFQSHPLGIAAVIILSFRVIQLTKKYFNSWHV
jgi:hypothetical protein